MSNTSTLSFRVEQDIINALDEAAAESRASRSGIAREAVLVGIEQLADEDGEISIPEHVAHDAKIKQLIARNKKTRRAGKFRSEFASQMKSSFKRNEHPDEFVRSVAGYVEEAEDMGALPEAVAEETGCETFAEWVEDKIEYYRTAHQISSYDHDPIENPLSGFDGIAGAREWLNRAEAIAAVEPSGGRTRREKQKEMARLAVQDGVVPDAIIEQINGDPREAVVEAADELAGGNMEALE
jgi:predicted transcriptional regulator